MRPVVLTALTALFLFSAPSLTLRVHAEEVRYKGRPKPPVEDHGQYKKPPADRPQPPSQKPPLYKPPVDRPPAPRPPQHPIKKPPEQRPHEPPPEPPGPIFRQPIEPPCPPPAPYPVPIWEPYPIDPPGDNDVIAPIPAGINRVLAQKVRQMQIEGFTGEVVVGYAGHIEFQGASAGGYYDIGSATEAFTAWAIYCLIGERKLELGTTLGELFPFAPADKRGITIEQLLGNTSGLGNTFAAGDETDRDTAVRKLLAQPLAAAPGNKFVDSDDGYVILAAAIAVRSGMRYERYLEASGVVSPDMTSTLFWSDLRSGHGVENWGRRGSGGIFSTAHDLYQWASRFVAQPPYVTDEIMRPRVRTDYGVGVGYGWFCWADEETSARWMSGTGASEENVRVVVYPAGAILVVTSDRYQGGVPWSERVANALEPVLFAWAPPPSVWQLHANSPLPQSTWTKYANSPTHDDGSVVVDEDAR